MHGMKLRSSSFNWMQHPLTDGVIIPYHLYPSAEDTRELYKRQGRKNRFMQSNFDQMNATIRVRPEVVADVPIIDGDKSFHFIDSDDERYYACALESHPPIIPSEIQSIMDEFHLDTFVQSWECRGPASWSYWNICYSWIAFNSKEVPVYPVKEDNLRVIACYHTYRISSKKTITNPREALSYIRNKYIPMNLAQCSSKDLKYTSRIGMYPYNIKAASIPESFYDNNYLHNLTTLAIQNSITSRQANELQGSALSSAVDGARTTEVINIENLFQFVDFVKDLPNWPSALSDLANVDVTKVKQATKLLANAKLQYDYAYKTTVSDAVRLVNDFKRVPPPKSNLSRGRSSGSFESEFGSYHVMIERNEGYRIYYGGVDESTLKFYRRLQDIGLDPSFEHVWDSIPYSFVVDWLLPVGKLLKEVDYDTNVSTLPVYAYTHTRWDKLELYNGSVSIEFSIYTRRIGEKLPNYPYFLPSDTPHVNWWNAGALIVQRIR